MVLWNAGLVHIVRWLFCRDRPEMGDVHRDCPGSFAGGDDPVSGRAVRRRDVVQAAGLGDGADGIVFGDVDLSAGGRGMGNLQARAGGTIFGRADVYGHLAWGAECDDGGGGDLDSETGDKVVGVGEEIEEGGV